MARAPIAGSGASGAARNRVVITSPAANTAVNYNAPSSRTFVLEGIDPSSASYVRNGSNLEIRLDNGAVVNLVRYFAVGDSRPLATFEMADGNVITGDDLLAAFAPDLDRTRQAAGPSAATPTTAPGGSGVGDYRGDLGELIQGVDRLGMLPTQYWDNSTLRDFEEITADWFNDISIDTPFRSNSYVDEAGLPNGTNPGNGLESDWSPLVLPENVTIVGVPEGGVGQFEGQYVTLYVRHLGDSNYEFMYVLKNPFTSPEGDNDRNLETDAELITLPITNGTDTGTIRVAVNILDDIPIVTLGEGEGEYFDDGSGNFYSGYPITGDWDINYGADGRHPNEPMEVLVTVTPIDDAGNPGTPVQQSFIVTLGQPTDLNMSGTPYGTITFFDDGTYEFVPVGDLTADYNIKLGGRDSDNDLAYSNNGNGLDFSIVTPPGPEDGFGNQWFHEGNLPEGTVANATQTTKEISIPVGFTIDVNTPSSNGATWVRTTDADGNTCYTMTDNDAYGYLTYYPPVEGADYQPSRLTYTLTKNAPHAEPDGKDYGSKDADPSQTFYDTAYGEITLMDSGGNRYKEPTSFKIYDDEPVVTLDAVTGETVYSGWDSHGTWSVVFGSDGEETDKDSRVLEVQLVGGGKITLPLEVLSSADAGQGMKIEIGGIVYGYVKFIEGGDFIFTASPNLVADLIFTLTGYDDDGDLDSQSLPISIVPPPGPGPLELKDPTPIDEDNLKEGGDDSDLIREIIIPPGYVIDTDKDGWEEDPDNPGKYTKDTDKGTLTYDPEENKLEYELKEPLDHTTDPGGVLPDIVDEITLEDEKGNTFPTEPVEVPVKDSVPTIEVDLPDGNTVEPGDTIGGNVDIDFGPDGPNEEDPVVIEVEVGGKTEEFEYTPGEGPQTFPITDDKGNPIGELEVDIDDDGKGKFEFTPDPDAPPTDIEIEIIGKDKEGTPTEGGKVDISIVDPEGPGINYLGGDQIFNEAHLPDGTAFANGAGLTKELTVPDGFSIDPEQGSWVEQPDGTFRMPGTYGYLTCSADGKTLTYTLTDEAPHEDAKGRNTTKEIIEGIVLKDADGNSYDAIPAKITIVDDIPEVSMDGNAADNVITSGNSFTGTWDAVFGADGKADAEYLQLKVSLGKESTVITIDLDQPDASYDIVINGDKYGTISFDESDGSYTFTAAPNKTGTFLFELTATDHDGDKASDSFHVKVEASAGPGVDYITTEEGPSESNLPGGTDENPDDLTKPITLPDGFVVDTDQDGWEPDGEGNFVLETPKGELVYNPDDNTLEYTLKDPLEHPDPGKDSGLDEIPIHIKDPDGNSHEVDVRVPIEDDVPEASIGGPNDTVESGGDPLTGTWDVDFGADDPADDEPLVLVITKPGGENPLELVLDPDSDEPQVFDVIIDGVDYGTITVNPDNTFEFEAAPDLPPTRLDLVLTATDGDGDTISTPPFVISIIDPEGPDIAYLTTKDGQPFDEANFASGTDPNPGALTKELNLPDGYTVDYKQDGWVHERGTDRYYYKSPTETDADGNVVNGFGQLTYDASTGKLTYTLTERVYNTPAENDLGYDTIPGIVIVDANGKKGTLDVVVDITDDKPELSFEGDVKIISGGTYTGEWEYNFGADGSADQRPITIVVSDGVETMEYVIAIGSDTEISLGGNRYGALNINSDGTYTFQVEPGAQGKLTFNMTITDRDGDQATSGRPLEITINPELEIGPADGKGVYEKHLSDGRDPDTDAVTKLLQLPVTDDGEICVPDTTGWTKVGDNYILRGSGGYLKWNPGQEELTFTLEDSSLHPRPGQFDENDSITNTFKITVTDPDGNHYFANVKVPVYDDAPEFTPEIPGSVVSGNALEGDLGLVYGADGKSALTSEALVFSLKPVGAATASLFPVTIGDPLDIIVGGVKYGTLTVNPDYTFSFDTAANLESGFLIDFAATDADGDQTWAYGDGLPITVIEPIPPGDLTGTTVSESYLPNGSQSDVPGAADQLIKPVEIPDGFTVDTSTRDWSHLGNRIYEMVKDSGKLVYDAGSNTLTYELLQNLDHPDPDNSGQDDVVQDVFDLVLINTDGHKFDVEARIDVWDDAPTASIDTDAPTVSSGYSVGGALDFAYGADEAAASGYRTLTITGINGNTVAEFNDEALRMNGTPLRVGPYGTLTVDADGNFVFKANGNVVQDLTFTLKTTDGDGDTTEDSVLLTVRKPDGPDIVIGQGDKEYFDEANLVAKPEYNQEHSGSQIAESLLVKDIYTAGLLVDTSSGDGWVEVPGATNTWTLQGDNGFYTYVETGTGTAAKGRLTYTFTNSTEHEGDNLTGPSDKAYDEFSQIGTPGHITLKDLVGNTWLVPTKITIYDDGPKIEEFEGVTKTYSGEGFTCDLDVVFGADGPASGTDQPIVLNYSYAGITGSVELVDGQTQTITLSGGLGTATVVYEDGRFTFMPPANQTGTWNLEVVATDSDGDSASKALAVEVEKRPAPEGPISATDPLNEAWLPDGTSPSPDSLTTELKLPDGYTVDTSVDNWQPTADGHTKKVPNGTLEHKDGTLTYTLDEELDHPDPGTDDKDVDFGNTTITIKDEFGNTYVVGDDDNPNSEVPITVPVTDDVPPAIEHTLEETVVREGTSVDGHFAADPEYGADGEHPDTPLQVKLGVRGGEETIIPITPGQTVPVVIDGEPYGTLILHPDYTYTFTVNPNSPHVGDRIDISYVIKDADGDETWSNVQTVRIEDSDPDVPFELRGIVYESELPDGSSASVTNPVITLAVPESYADLGWTLTIDDSAGSGWQSDPRGGHYLDTAHGTLHFNNGVLTYTLNQAATHDAPSGGALADNNSFYEEISDKILVKDPQDNVIDTPVFAEIEIVDDIPVVTMGGSPQGTNVTSGKVYEGTWSVDYGADGQYADNTRLQLVVSDEDGREQTINVIDGRALNVLVGGVFYGTIAFDLTDNTYAFTANPDRQGSLNFVLAAKDSDGDVAKAGQFTLTIDPAKGPDEDVLEGKAPVDEAHLSTGTNPGGGDLITEITLPEGNFTLDTSDPSVWVPSGNGYRLDQADKSGHLYYENGKLYYYLDSAYDHPDGNDRQLGSETFTDIVFKDGDGNSFELDVKVDIRDDIPLVDLDGDKTVNSGATCDGTWDVNPGADDYDATAPLSLVVKDANGNTIAEIDDIQFDTSYPVGTGNNAMGSIVFKEDGTYEFTALPNVEATLTFMLNAKDSDGDTVGDAHTIAIQEKDFPGLLEVDVYEANLLQGSNPDSGALVQNIIDNTDPNSLFYDYKVDVTQGGWQQVAGGWELYITDSTSGGLISRGVLRCESDPSDPTSKLGMNLSYELRQPMDHEFGSSSGAGAVGLETALPSIVLVDSQGNTYTKDVVARIHDDEPSLSFDETSGSVTSGLTYNGEYDLSFGADGSPTDGSAGVTVVVRLGASGTGPYVTLDMNTGSASGADVIINGVNYGRLTLTDDENFTFAAKPNINADLSFNMTVTDADGDAVAADSPFVLSIRKPDRDLDDLTFKDPIGEENLPHGTVGETSQLVRGLEVPFELVVDVKQPGWEYKGPNTTGSGYVYEKSDAYGTLTYIVIDPNVTEWNDYDRLTYTLNKEAAHSLPGTAGDEIYYNSMGSVVFKDQLGNTFEAGTLFPIQDDVPLVELADNATASGGATYSANYKAEHGADGPASQDSMRISLAIEDEQNNVDFILEGPISIGTPYVVEHAGINYGTIVFSDDGRYYFDVAPNVNAMVTMTLSLKDGDGDTTSSTQTIAIDTKAPPPTTLTAAVNEANFENTTTDQPYKGTNPDDDALTQTIALPVLPGGATGTYGIVTDPSVTSANWVRDAGGAAVWTLDTAYGYLTYSETGTHPTLTYTLEKAPSERGAGANVFEESIPDIMIKDADNNAFDVGMVVSITDDVPQASIGTSGSSQVKWGNTFNDGTWAVNYGADGPASANNLMLTVTDTSNRTGTFSVVPNTDMVINLGGIDYGTLRFDSSTNKFSFTARQTDQSTTLTFNLAATDGDGDITTSQFSLRIMEADEPEYYFGQGKEFWEASLSNGSNPDNLPNSDRSTTQNLNLPSDLTVVPDRADGWVQDTATSNWYLTLGHGRILCSADGKTVRYELLNPIQNVEAGTGNEPDLMGYDTHAGIKVRDADGNLWYLPAKIQINDDIPLVDFGSEPADKYNVASGDTVTDAQGFIFSFGADGGATRDSLMLTYVITDENGVESERTVSISHTGTGREIYTDTNVKIGTIQLDAATDTFTFIAEPNIGITSPVKVELQLKATDGDGDQVTSGKVEVTITKPDGPEKENIADGLIFKEENLKGGTSESTNNNDFIKEIDLSQYSIGNRDFTPDLTGWRNEGNNTWSTTGSFNTGKLVWDANSQTLEYHFLTRGEHDGEGKDIELDVFPNFKLKDTLGNTYEMDAEVAIQDDAPLVTLTLDNPSGTVTTGDPFSGDYSYHHGLDGKASANDLVVKITLPDGTTAQFSGSALHLDGTAMQVTGGDGTLWGTLTMNNGEFTYKTEGNTPVSNKEGEVKIEFIATDSEGDTTSTSVTQQVGPPAKLNWKIGEGEYFDEANLTDEGGRQPGSNPSVNALTKQLTLHGYTIDPDPADGWTQTGPNTGVWTLRGNNGYLTYTEGSRFVSFTLTERAEHELENIIGSGDSFFDEFSDVEVTVVDSQGNGQKVGVAIEIYDDGPYVTQFDSSSDPLDSGDSFTGTYLYVFGADGPAATKSMVLQYQLDDGQVQEVDITIGTPTVLDVNGVKGTITFESNSRFTFKPDPDTEGTWKMNLVIKDADGDTSSAGPQAVFEVEKPTPPPPFTVAKDFDESYLTGGTNEGGGDPSDLRQEINLNGYTVDTSGGSWKTDPEGHALEIANGKLIYTSAGKLFFELTDAQDHPAPATNGWDLNTDRIDFGTTTFVVVDNLGNTYTVGMGSATYDTEIVMNVKDDAPAVFDISFENSGGVESGYSISGSVDIPLKVGADGPADGTPNDDGLTVTVTRGNDTITLTNIAMTGTTSQEVRFGSELLGTFTYDAANQSFVFDTEGNKGGTNLTFTFSVEDADGDRHTDSAEVRIRAVGDPPDKVTFPSFDEQHLSDGTSPDASLLTKTVAMPDPNFWVRYDSTWTGDETGGIWTRSNAAGTLTYNKSTNSFTFELKNPSAHDDGDGRNSLNLLLGNISLIDQGNNRFDNWFTVEIPVIDDIPELDITSATGNVDSGAKYSGTWTHKFGADGPANNDPTKVTVAVQAVEAGETQNFTVELGTETTIRIGNVVYGTLLLDSNGKLEFNAEPNREQTLNLSMTIADSDGDTATDSISIKITKPEVTQPDITGGQVDESALPDGSGGGQGSDRTTIDLSDATDQGFTIDTDHDDWRLDPGTGNYINDKDPNGQLVYDPDTGTLEYILTSPLTHTDPGRDVADKVIEDIVFKDADGNTYEFDIEFTVMDDQPIVTITDLIEVDAGGTFSGGDWKVAHGADGNLLGNNDHYAVVIKDGNNTLVNLTNYTPGEEIDIAGYGKLTLNTDGTVSFEGVANGLFDIDITLSATDTDGDTDSSTLRLVTSLPGSLKLPSVVVNEANLQHGTSPSEEALTVWVNPTNPAMPNYNADNAQFTIDLSKGEWHVYPGSNGATYFFGDADPVTGRPTSSGVLLCSSSDGKEGYDLRYTLLSTFEHPAPVPAGTSDTNSLFDIAQGITFLDQNKNSHVHNVPVEVKDDVPMVEFNQAQDSIETGQTYNGGYLLTFGADGSPDGGLGINLVIKDDKGNTLVNTNVGTGQTVVPGYGVLTLTAGNDFSFEAYPVGPEVPAGTYATLNFTIKVTDRDADTTEAAEFKLELTKPAAPVITPPDNLNVFESGSLPEASGVRPDWAQNVSDEVFESPERVWELPDNVKVDTSVGNWTEVNGVFTQTSATGKLEWIQDANNNKLVYTLTNPGAHGEDGIDNPDEPLSDTFAGVTILDADGNAYSYPITVMIVDDMPVLGDGVDESLGEGDNFTTDEREVEIALGADGVGNEADDYFTLEMTFDVPAGSYVDTKSVSVQIPRDGTAADTPVEVKTVLGTIKLTYDPQTEKLTYVYEASRGAKGDKENITYTLTDNDGDTVTQDFTITLDDTVIEGFLVVDEAALPFGSNAEDAGTTVAVTTLRDVAFEGEAVGVEWDIAAIQETYGGYPISADGNFDGAYDQLNWSQENGVLSGYAEDGTLAIRVTAEIAQNDAGDFYFTGQIKAELFRAFEHNQSEDDKELSFNLSFNQINASGDKVPSVIKVTIVDDEPFRGTESQHAIYLEENPERFEEVFIAFDCSTSMTDSPVAGTGKYRWEIAIEALVELVEAYEANGITAEFTIVGFASEATVNPVFQGMTTADFLSLYHTLGGNGDAAAVTEANQSLWDLIRQNFTTGVDLDSSVANNTNYVAATEKLIEELEGSLANSSKSEWDKTVYFMTDGEARPRTAPADWYEYLREHPDDFEVYAIGMTNDVTPFAQNMLVDMTGGNEDNFVLVENMSVLGDVLQSLIRPVTGNLLENIGSADANTITAVWIGEAGWDKDTVIASGDKYTIPEDGNSGEISLGTGENEVKIIIYPDGTYEVISGSVSDTSYYKIVIEALDADGDPRDVNGNLIRSDAIDLVVVDAEPLAFDNIAIFDQVTGQDYALEYASSGWEFMTATNVRGQQQVTAEVVDSLPAGVIPDTNALLNQHADGSYLHITANLDIYSSYLEHSGYSMFFWDLAEHIIDADILFPAGSGLHSPWNYCGMASHEIQATSGTITFGWAATGSQNDTSFWVLVDSKGNIVDSGKLATLGSSGSASGIETVVLPINDGTETYKIVFGTFEDVGRGSGTAPASQLYINAVVVEEDSYDFKGNILTDPSPKGEVDLMYDMAYLSAVNGIPFGDKQQLTITGKEGTLIINKNGDYIYTCNDPSKATQIKEEFTYVITDRDGDTSDAVLTVQWQQPVAYEKLATLDSGGNFSGNMITDMAINGEEGDSRYNTTLLESFTINGVPYTFTPQSSQLVANTPDGSLTVNRDGTYTFDPRSTASSVAQKLTYTLTDGEQNQGVLHIQVVAPQAYDNVAASEQGFDSSRVLYRFSNGTEGWQTLAGSVSRVTDFPSNLLKPQDHPALPADDSNYLLISGAQSMNAATVQRLFDTGANKSLEDRLTEMGVEGNAVGSGNNPISGSFASQSISTAGGKLVFDWAFGGEQTASASDSDLDAAIYVLQDAEGNVVSSGLLGQLMRQGDSVKKYGVAEIDVPIFSTPQQYTLYIGQIQVSENGNYLGSQTTQLVIGSVAMMEDKYHFAGNLITDASPDGQVDLVPANSRISSILYEGKPYTPEGGVITVKTESGGTLIVEADGSYYYSDAPGSDGTRVAENFEYTVTSPSGDTGTAMLFIRGDSYRIEGSAGMTEIETGSGKYTGGSYLVTGSDGDDKITAGSESNIIYGEGGDDTITVNQGTWTQGQTYDGHRLYGGAGDDSITGGHGNDTIHGGPGNDIINGGRGSDLIFGGSGENTLTGGLGSDTFGWQRTTDLSGKDIITDFSTTQGDRLSFRDLLSDGESLDSLIKDPRLEEGTNTSKLIFTIEDGTFSKEVELTFSSSDTGFRQLNADYIASGQDDQVIINYLHTISS